MDTRQIRAVLSRTLGQSFAGVYPRDLIPSQLRPYEKAIVVNTSPGWDEPPQIGRRSTAGTLGKGSGWRPWEAIAAPRHLQTQEALHLEVPPRLYTQNALTKLPSTAVPQGGISDLSSGQGPLYTGGTAGGSSRSFLNSYSPKKGDSGE